MEAASLVVHIVAGILAIFAGYVAISAARGGRLHRRSGMLFVYAMLVMGMTATVVAAFAFWIATGSFFFGQMDEFPVPPQKPWLAAVPALLALVLMVYWLWRVRGRRMLPGLVLRPT